MYKEVLLRDQYTDTQKETFSFCRFVLLCRLAVLVKKTRKNTSVGWISKVIFTQSSENGVNFHSAALKNMKGYSLREAIIGHRMRSAFFLRSLLYLITISKISYNPFSQIFKDEALTSCMSYVKINHTLF